MSEVQTPPPAVTDSAEERQGNRKLLLLLVGVVGVVVLGAAAYFLFLSGGEEEPLPPITKGTPAAEADADKADKNNGGQGENSGEGQVIPDPVDDDLKVGTDPFEPLAAETVVVVADETDGGAVPVEDDGSTAGSTGGTTGGTAGGTNGGKDDPAATIMVVKVHAVNAKTEKATVLVDGKSYQVKQGSIFPSTTTGPFKIVDIGTTDKGEAYIKLAYGSDLPAILQVGQQAVFG